MKLRKACPLTVVFVCLCLRLTSQTQHAPAPQAIVPLEAELVSGLSQDKLKPGSPVVTRTLQAWKSTSCAIVMGSLIEGEIVSAERDAAKKMAAITIRLKPVLCNGGGENRTTLRMFSLVIPPNLSVENNYTKRGGIYAGYTPVVADGTTNYATALSSAGGLHMDWAPSKRDDSPRTAQLGAVIGTKNLTLEPDGPDNSFTIRQKGKNVELYPGSIFVLIPREKATTVGKDRARVETEDSASKVGVGSGAKALSVSERVPQPLKEELPACERDCSIVTMPEMFANEKPSGGNVIDLERYGYHHVAYHAVPKFAAVDALVYLDDSHLLFAFDRHVMRRRIGAEIRSEYERSVRAVLLDTKKRQVLKVVDWKVLGDERYLWPASNGRVLVHLGRSLVLFDNRLEVQERMGVPALLQWVTSDPSGSLFAVGTLKELHTGLLHKTLFDASGREPDESTEVSFLDSNLRVIATSTQPSNFEKPVLAKSSEIRVESQPNHKWTVEELSSSLNRHRVATVLSDCTPHTSTPSDSLVFVAGCLNGQNWYRAFRLDGHMVIRGASSSREVEQAALGEANQRAFAVRVVESAAPSAYETEYKQADLPREYIGVYQVKDGRAIFGTSVNDVAFTDQSFALSPGASQLAVLTTRSLKLFDLPAATH